MRTEVNELGRVIVIDEIPNDTPQAYTVCVKDPNDWEEMHDYIINENEIDGIPNRRILCISSMSCSTKRSVYEMSNDEADVLRNHSKVEWVEKSSMHNPSVLEQRKYDEEFDKHAFTNRFKENARGIRSTLTNPSSRVDVQWGLHRHVRKDSSDYTANISNLDEDLQYSLTGKNVDIVIMDTGVRWDHPDFIKKEYFDSGNIFNDANVTIPTGVSTATASRVRDIIIHGESEYGIDWSTHGLAEPGVEGALSNYTIANVLESDNNWHGSHVAGIAAGTLSGWAFEANIWSIACIDRSDVGFSDPADGFDYIRVWHKNKPINPETGRRNPTIVNGSWGFSQYVYKTSQDYSAVYRGNTYTKTYIESSSSNLPPIYYYPVENFGGRGSEEYRFKFTVVKTSSQSTTDELFDDSDCDDIICVFSAGNNAHKQDVPGEDDYDNRFTGETVVYSSGYGTSYYHRSGTPAISHIGQKDAPISVGALENRINTYSNQGDVESLDSYSNTGPAVDILAAGGNIFAPTPQTDASALNIYSGGSVNGVTYYRGQKSGTSAASPQVAGVLALYLESYPKATRVDVRNWLYKHGSVVVGCGTAGEIGGSIRFWDSSKGMNPVGAGTSESYYHGSNVFYDNPLQGGVPRILYNPFANNVKPNISGVNLSGISFKQS